MAVDSLDSCGVYFGTTGGQVYASPDGGDHWTAIVRDLPPVLSVEVQTLLYGAIRNAECGNEAQFGTGSGDRHLESGG